MAFNLYNLPMLEDAPTENKDFPYYCEYGKAPSIQFIIGAGQVMGTATLTNGTETQHMPYPITYIDETTFRIVQLAQIDFNVTLTGNTWIQITVGSDTYYSPFIKFGESSCLWKIEYSHHEPIVHLSGEYVSYDNGFKQYIYLPKVTREAVYNPQTTTDERDLVNFDKHKVLKKQSTFEVFGDEYLMDALMNLEGHSYIIFDGENVSEFEVEPEKYDTTKYLAKVTCTVEGIISTNAGNGIAYSNLFDINALVVPGYIPSIDCQMPLISDVKARLLYNDTAPTVALYKDDVLDTSFIQSSTTQDNLQCRHILNTTPLDLDGIYHYLIDGKKSASFRAPKAGEDLLRIKVSHDGIIYNGNEGIHYEGVGYLEGLYRFYNNFPIDTEIEPDELVNDQDLIEFKLYTVKKKWYTTKIFTHVAALDFLQFADINDSVDIITPNKTYQTHALEITEIEKQSPSKAIVTLRWNIGEVVRTRNSARSLSIHGDYNGDYNADYKNF